LVSDNILVTKLSPKEAARGYLVSLKASSYSARGQWGEVMCLEIPWLLIDTPLGVASWADSG